MTSSPPFAAVTALCRILPKMLQVLALCPLLLVLGSPGQARALEIREVTSPSGLTGWLLQDSSVPLVSVSFAFRGGSALDPEGKEGLAAMAAALLLEGAGDLPAEAFQTELESRSIALQLQAGRDGLFGSMRTLVRERQQAARLLGKALSNPRFDPEAVARIRARSLAALEQQAQNPQAVASERWDARMFEDHPYGRPAHGTPQGIAGLDVEDLQAFVRQRLTRDGLLVAAVGDLDEAAFAELLDTAFADLPARGTDWRLAEATLPDQGSLEVIRKAVPQSVAVFGHGGPRRSDPEWYAALILNHVLGGGALTSRLGESVRERRGLAYSVHSSLSPLDFAGTIRGAVATENARIAESLALIREEWRRLGEEPLSAEELEDAKIYLTGSFITRLTSTGQIARLLLAMQREGLGRDYLARRDALIRGVDLDTIHSLAARLFDPDALTVVVVGDPVGLDPEAPTIR